MGGLDPVYTFERGSPEAVRAAVKQAMTDAGSGGGYVVATAEAVAPATPAECIHAAVRAAREYGTY